MQLRAVLKPNRLPFSISHHDTLLTLGSCFSENIGERFGNYKFNIVINPFGQQYNPHSIANGLHRLVTNQVYISEELFEFAEQFHNWDFHSDYSDSNREGALENMNQSFRTAREQLLKANYLFITFGTAHLFRHNESAIDVSNCHKISGSQFSKRYLNTEEIVALMTNAINEVRKANPTCKIIFTVSPVRYLAFGFEENNLSKAYLISAVHELCSSLSETYYFPAYELVMDDLRDYRFFTEDFLHPNRMATQYVWENLANTIFNDDTKSLLIEIDKVLSAANHRPRNPLSNAHRSFLTKFLKLAEQLELSHPYLNFNSEKALFNNGLQQISAS
ncbi:MAG: GSCFA domain-containing protein [Chitinophagales bacterium]|nr:GSCFA domain-containing protein [Chitinophagales bacterium]